MSKVYDDKVAVSDLNLAIEKNTCFGLLGPNGAGKTTLIHCLTGFDSPTSGDAWICGHSIKSEMDSVYRNIGVCPQYCSIFRIHQFSFTDLIFCGQLSVWKKHFYSIFA